MPRAAMLSPAPDRLRRLGDLGIDYKDLRTTERSLEEIFVSLVGDRK